MEKLKRSEGLSQNKNILNFKFEKNLSYQSNTHLNIFKDKDLSIIVRDPFIFSLKKKSELKPVWDTVRQIYPYKYSITRF